MQVQLISRTQPEPGIIPDVEITDLEQLIIYIARVSSGREDGDKLTGYANLVRYLIREGHWSPFEMGGFCFKIVTSRAIAAQILRHRSFSFQEFSQRYAKATAMEPVQLRMQADKNRQSSSSVLDNDYAVAVVHDQLRSAEAAYNELLSLGVAKECARMALPLTTQTTIYMNGTLRSWIHYLDQRCDDHTQLEHRAIANQIRASLTSALPTIARALGWGV